MGFRLRGNPLLGRRLAKRFTKFPAIGVLNTLIHLAVVSGLAEFFYMHPVTANCAAFVAANLFSFFANSYFNYHTPITITLYGRFLTVSLGGLSITAILSAFATMQGWHYLIGTAMVFVTLPVLTFTVHHWWTWKEDEIENH